MLAARADDDVRLCTGAPWVNGLLLVAKAALPPATDKSESFHPNVDGQNALFSLLSPVLATF